MTGWRIIIVLLLGSAIFSASELAIMGVPLYKIKRGLRQDPNNRRIRILHKLRQNPERTLIGILIGNNLMNVVFSIFTDKLSSGLLEQRAISGFLGSIIIVSTITFLLLLFGEIMPKAFATKFALHIALWFAPVMNILNYLLIWVIRPLEKIVKYINSFFKESEGGVSRDDIEIFVEDGEKQGLFTSQESMMVRNIMDFRQTSVESVSRHRIEIFALDQEETIQDAVAKVLHKPYSRIPIYQKNKDHIIGIITIRDLLQIASDSNNTLKKIKDFQISTIAKVPVTASIFDMFMEMKKHGWHMAIVIDEYGGTAGLVTFEDILEAMVGDIKDESDQYEEQDIFELSPKSILVKGDVIIRDILHHFKIAQLTPIDYSDDNIVDEEDMVSSIILEHLKSFAQKGDKVDLGSIILEVHQIDPKTESIEKVKVIKKH